MKNDLENKHFQLALKFVNQTDRNVFITGRAGTGKTTFLKHLREYGTKKMAVVAPTGVAAINAGGVTIHSFFQLAPGTFIPGNHHSWNQQTLRIFNSDSVISNLRLRKEKKDLIRELELLVIDEVSMVKADTLDAVDTILRWVRREPRLPFGGVQVIFIGDLFQLPPVMPDEEWDLLKTHYNSPFFFDALVMNQAPPVHLELKKVYRQKDDDFISLLNAVRNNIVTKEELDQINQRYLPHFKPADGDTYITLTTHNAKADVINHMAMKNLKGTARYFNAVIDGDFPDKAFPVEEKLCLKPGAQVMFIKNDKGESRRYFNGRIGKISRLDDDDNIFVQFPGEETELELEKETWVNIRYQFNKQKNIVEEEELGSFKQYPVRLAWAITIHKSQGLTFEKAIIDAGDSFSPGQVYVALSRLTGIEGLILHSRISSPSIQTDNRVIRFSERFQNDQVLETQLANDQKSFIHTTLIKCFGLEKLVDDLDIFHEVIPEEETDAARDELFFWANELTEKIKEQQIIADKFRQQLEKLLENEKDNNYAKVLERVKSAKAWFTKFLAEWKSATITTSSNIHQKKTIRKFRKALTDFELSLSTKERQINSGFDIAEALSTGSSTEAVLQLAERRPVPEVRNTENVFVTKNHRAGSGTIKIPSAQISRQLFKAGKTISEISFERNFTEGTIYGHLTQFIESGEIRVEELVPAEKIKVIKEAITTTEGDSMKTVKEKLGNNYSYHEIRAVFHQLNSEKQQPIQ